MKKGLMIFVGLVVAAVVGYNTYLNFPVKYSVDQCISDSTTGEIYKVVKKPRRGTQEQIIIRSGPMLVETEVVKVNPNTQRQLKDLRVFDQDDQAISSIACP